MDAFAIPHTMEDVCDQLGFVFELSPMLARAPVQIRRHKDQCYRGNK